MPDAGGVNAFGARYNSQMGAGALGWWCQQLEPLGSQGHQPEQVGDLASAAWGDQVSGASRGAERQVPGAGGWDGGQVSVFPLNLVLGSGTRQLVWLCQYLGGPVSLGWL